MQYNFHTGLNLTIAHLFKVSILTTLLFLFGSITCSTAISAELDFATAWQQLKEKSYKLQAEEASIEHAVHQHEASKDLYLPQININAGYLYLDDKVQLSPSDIFDSMPAGPLIEKEIASMAQAYKIPPQALEHGFTSTLSDRDVKDVSVSLLWPVYTGGRIAAANKLSENSIVKAKKQREATLNSQFTELSQRYFGVIMLQQLLETMREMVESFKKHLQHAQLLVKNGQIAEVERLQAEASYDKAQADMQKAASDLQIATVALTTLLQEETGVKPTSPLFINSKLPELRTFTQKTLQNHPGLAIIKSKKAMARNMVTMEEGRYYPEVALVGNYNLYKEDDLASEMVPDWLVGITMKVPIVDREGRKGKKLAAQSLVTKADALQKQAREDLLTLVEKNYREAEQAITEYQRLASSLKLARKTLEMRKKAFDQGVATSLQVTDAALYVASVKNKRSRAKYIYVTKLAELLALSDEVDSFYKYQQSALTP